MANFVLLYTGGSMPETEAERAKAMDAWGAWFAGLADAVVDAGNPFGPAAKKIASDGVVSDGPVGVMASGYSIVKTDSLNAAVRLAQGCPVLQGGAQITIYETIPVM